MFFFFFSSRRRHTRWNCDWSSDVCSSDLPAELLAEAVLAESDPNVAGALRWALARTGGDGVASLAAGLESDDARVRLRAVLMLAELAGDDVTAMLIDALGDADPAVRRR